MLKSTGDSILVEAADCDSQWGVLLKEGLPQVHDLREWRGWNVLGEALMITREHLLTEEPLWQQRFFSTSLSGQFKIAGHKRCARVRPAEPEKPTHVMRLVESLLRPAVLARPIKNQKLVSEARARLCSRGARLVRFD